MARGTSADAGADTWLRWLTAAAVLASLLFRLIRLASLPGEMYGDIAIVYEFVSAARGGSWPTYFVLSTGPLYHYLVVPIVWFTGLDFQGLKAASALVSLGVLAATYGVARELVDRSLAVVSLFVAGVSSWLLVFSRLGGSLIVTPLLSMGAVYFAIRVARLHRWWQAAACGVIAAAGLYAYPPTFVLAPVMFVTLVCLLTTKVGVRWRDVLIFSGAALVAALPFLYIVHRDSDSFFNGYIGSHFDSSHGGRWSTLFGNLRRTLLAFNVHGDTIFRSNPARLPHLDTISGALFLLGIVWWLRPERRRWAPVILVPFLLLLVPSMLVFSEPGEVPSAGRTLSSAPFAYVLVASGLCWLVSWIPRRVWGCLWGGVWVPRAVTAIVLVSITVANGHRYFVTYADGLPNHNVPFGRIIADYLHELPDQQTHAFIIDCCWGEHGQPEPKGIQYLGAGPVATSMTVLTSDLLDCAAIAELPRPALLIWTPADDVPVGLEPCADQLTPQLHTSDGQQIFWSSEL